MKKKKGFTMVELLAVIVIIGILSVVGTVTATNIINKARREYYKKQENLILISGKEYYSDYRSKLPKQVGGTGEVTLKTLVGEKYIKPVEGYQNHSCDVEKSAVYVQKLGESNYVYSILMDCDDYNTSTNGSSPVITFLPNSKRSNKAITVEMKVKDDKAVSDYSYQVYKLGSKEDSEGQVIESVSKTKYNKVIKIKLEEDGIYKIRGTAWDNEENATIKDSGVYEIDNTPPDCKKLVINTDYEKNMTGENWTSKNVKLTLDFGQVGEIESWDWETNKDSRKCTWDYITKNEQLDQIVTGKNSSFYYQSNNKASTKTKTISGEGARQGRITLYDEFGNSCKVTTEKFLIDKTEISSLTLSGSTASGKVTNKDVRLTATPSPKCVRSGYTYIFERKEGNNWIEVSRQASNEYTVHIEYNQEIDYEYRVRVITGSGKTKTSSNQYRVHIDKIPPKCDMVSFSPNGKTWTNQDISVTVRTNNNDIKTFDVLRNLNSAGYATYQYARSGVSSTLTLSEEGIHYLQVRGYDEAGNTCEVNATSNPYYIDKTKPSCTVSLSGTTGNNGWYKSNNVSVSLTTQDNGTYQSQVNGYDLTTSSSASYSGRTSGSQGNTGGITWYGYVKDAAGNTNKCNSPNFKVDTVSPSCNAVASKTGWTNQSVTVTGQCSDTGGSTCAGNSTTTVSSDTNGNIQPPNVEDKAGNAGTCNSVLVQVDTKKPVCTTTSSASGWTNAATVTVSGTCTSDTGGSGCKSNANGATVNYDTNSAISPGSVSDYAGNVTTCDSITVQRDTVAPSCTYAKTATGTGGVSVGLTSCSDGSGSGATSCNYYATGLSGLTGPTTYYSSDNAGNVGACATVSVTAVTQWRKNHCGTCKSCDNKSNCTSRAASTCKGWTTTYSCGCGGTRSGTTCTLQSTYASYCGNTCGGNFTLASSGGNGTCKYTASSSKSCTGGWQQGACLSYAQQTSCQNCGGCKSGGWDGWTKWEDNSRCKASNIPIGKCKEESRVIYQ